MYYIQNLHYRDVIRKIAEAGFNLIELGGDLELLLPHFFSGDQINELFDIKKDLDLQYTVHLPLWSVEPSTPLNPIRDGSITSIVNHINKIKVLEPEIYVLHATGALAAEFYQMSLPELAKDYLLNQFAQNAKDSIDQILEQTKLNSKKLAIETIEFPFDLTLEIAEEMDLSICFDTGHVFVGFSGLISFFEAIHRCIDRISEFHLHDGPSVFKTNEIGYKKDHQVIGKGDLDYTKFLCDLNDSGFSGPIIFELSLSEAQESLRIINESIPIKDKSPGH